MFVFIIHATPDKARFAPIVHELMDAGVNVWIDNPGAPALRLSEAQITSVAGHCSPNEKWEDSCDSGLIEASAVLVVVSEESVRPERIQVFEEHRVARVRNRKEGVPVFYIGCEDKHLRQGDALLNGQQGYQTFTAKIEDRYVLTKQGQRQTGILVKDIKHALSSRRENSDPEVRLPASPHLADRALQSDELIEFARASKPELRALPVVLGRLHDCPDTFFKRYVPTKLSHRLLDGDISIPDPLHWPYHVARNPQGARERLVAEIGETIAEPGISYIVRAQPRPSDLRGPGAIEATIGLWCEVWDELLHTFPRADVLPFLDIRLDEIAGFKVFSMFPMRSADIEARIASIVQKLEGQYTRVRPACLTAFGPVTPYCADAWVQSDLIPLLDEPHLADAITSPIVRSVGRRGLPMEEWAKAAKKSYTEFLRSERGS